MSNPTQTNVEVPELYPKQYGREQMWQEQEFDKFCFEVQIDSITEAAKIMQAKQRELSPKSDLLLREEVGYLMWSISELTEHARSEGYSPRGHIFGAAQCSFFRGRRNH